VAGGLRLRLCVGIGREHRATCFMDQASLTQKENPAEARGKFQAWRMSGPRGLEGSPARLS
jgi:hypothetical protein